LTSVNLIQSGLAYLILKKELAKFQEIVTIAANCFKCKILAVCKKELEAVGVSV
jgi:sulfatase maturation enzyme AslB (radical SAM superfamily)